ncbi:hypothetical protein [Halosimplex litoreum]|nr:hypothetical protein [Halosimplex litoreum]
MGIFHRDFGSAANGVSVSEANGGSEGEPREPSGAVTNPGAKWE